MATRLSDAEATRALDDLDGWSIEDGKLRKEFRFDGFGAAFAFLARVALAAEKANHHPEITNVYDRVTIDLVTHDADGISELDVDMARTIDGF